MMSYISNRLAVCLITLCAITFISHSAYAENASPSKIDYSKLNARPQPQWLRDGIIYEVFVRNFSKEGTFKAVEERLDEIKDLGVNILWLMPIHPIGLEKRKGTVGSPYSIKDYYGIDESYGTAADFKSLIQKAHKRGMKVVIDIVANHTSWDSDFIKKHPEYFSRYKKGIKKGEIKPPMDGWADVAHLNYENKELQKEMINMFTYWTKEFDLDGFRCDVAEMVPTDFWETARVQLDKVKPDVMWLAEAETPDLQVKAFDMGYGWSLYKKLNSILALGQPASIIKTTVEKEIKTLPKNYLLMRFTDNHDEMRSTARWGQEGSKAATVLMYTLPGVPLIYNGREIADTAESNDPALFEKHPIFWEGAYKQPQWKILYKKLAALRASHSLLREKTEIVWVGNSSEDNVISFIRQNDQARFLTAINLTNRPVEVTLNLPADTISSLKKVPFDISITQTLKKKSSKVILGTLPKITLPAWGFVFYEGKGKK